MEQRYDYSNYFIQYDRTGNAIMPTDLTLSHAASEIDIGLHGRPFRDWFPYLIGILNGPNEPFGDSNNSKDWDVMTRFDSARSDYFFGWTVHFLAPKAASLFVTEPTMQWRRYRNERIHQAGNTVGREWSFCFIPLVPASTRSSRVNTSPGSKFI